MARFSGKLGYVFEDIEVSPGVWRPNIVEKSYKGDELSITLKNQSTENFNDNVVINNRVSVIGDPYAFQNFYAIKYLIWENVKWKVSSIQIERPRLICSIDGVYNG